MPVIYNSIMNVQVVRSATDEVRAETSLLATDSEAVGWLTADLPGLYIKECTYGIYRLADAQTGIFMVPELGGVEAYFDAGAMLKQAVGDAARGVAREVISECVRGVIQAETFFFTERGYANEKAYDAYWDEMYVNSCRYYSNLDKRDQTFIEVVGYSERSHNLFNRSKQVTLAEVDQGYSITACFMDSFHELALQLKLNNAGLVTEASGNFLRAPGHICGENNQHLNKLKGICLSTMGKREVADLAGGSEGCSHLVELIYEAAKAASHI